MIVLHLGTFVASRVEAADLSLITRHHMGLQETLVSFYGHGFKNITPEIS